MKKKIIFILCIATLILLIYIFVPHKKVIIFYEKNSDNIAAYLPSFNEQVFYITFVHSIHLTDVVEKYYVMHDNRIKQEEIVFEEFGIGMPSSVENEEQFVYENGKYHIKNLNNMFEELKIRNGKTVSEHRLTWYDKRNEQHIVYFNEFFKPGNWYTIKVEKKSLFVLWREVKIHD